MTLRVKGLIKQSLRVLSGATMTSPSPLLFNTYYHIYNRGTNGENIFIQERNSCLFAENKMTFANFLWKSRFLPQIWLNRANNRYEFPCPAWNLGYATGWPPNMALLKAVPLHMVVKRIRDFEDFSANGELFSPTKIILQPKYTLQDLKLRKFSIRTWSIRIVSPNLQKTANDIIRLG